jgi:hypothetical protein
MADDDGIKFGVPAERVMDDFLAKHAANDFINP